MNTKHPYCCDRALYERNFCHDIEEEDAEQLAEATRLVEAARLML